MHRKSSLASAWVKPMLGLAAIAVCVFVVLYAIDVAYTGGPTRADTGFFQYFFFDQDHITDAVSGLGAMVAAVLGIVITVVSIVVQLSAERYTSVTSMFFRDRTNIAVMAFYVVACVCGVWVSLSLRADFVPRASLFFMLVMTVIGLVMMAPYFNYVFRFLQPANIVERIQREAAENAERAAAGRHADTAPLQASTLAAMEELTDITSNSISGKDKIIASRAVDALKDLAIRYMQHKDALRPEWFSIGEEIRDNPDFVAMDPESLGDLVTRRTWFEWKIMRQYLGIYNEALGPMRDINYLIAIDTRYIGEAAMTRKDDEVVELTFRFMNSYLRATLNARDVRTAYNICNQYRLLIESLLKHSYVEAAVEAVGYLKYYAHVSYDMSISFVTETIAYDVGALCQLAHELGLPQEDGFLRTFLDVDRPTFERSHETALKGVRKAQVKLASYYLLAGEEAKARIIYDDMAHEPKERLFTIFDELKRVESKDFWEIIDRGRNFEYMPDAQRDAMKRYADWFDLEAPGSQRVAKTDGGRT